MLDIGMLELFVIGALALIVVGPKELPGLLRSVGQFAAKARGMAREFQSSMEEAAREADLDGVVKSVKSGNKLPFDNQIVDTMKEFEKSVKTEINSADAEVRAEAPKDDASAPKEPFDRTKFSKPAEPAPEGAEPAKVEARADATVDAATPAAKAEAPAAVEKPAAAKPAAAKPAAKEKSA